MKKLFICCILLLTATFAVSAERKQIQNVDTDAYTRDTQVVPKETGDNHVAITWWISNEFWESILARDTTTNPADKRAMLNAMSGISLLAVVQADISNLGAFNFYPKDEIQKKMQITFTDATGRKSSLKPLEDINPDLKVVLGIFKPILGAAMGNLGKNMHFYVLNDKSNSGRLVDPYKKGLLKMELFKRDSTQLTAEVATPLNSLFIPRKCPNGKDAHVSWNFCPWSGKQLAE